MKRIGPFLSLTFLFFAISATANAQILAWDTTGLAGGVGTFNSTTTNTHLNVSGLSRGPGLVFKSNANTYNSQGFTTSTLLADAITNNDYHQFTVSALSGFKISLSTLDANVYRDGSGPTRFQWQYSLDGFATAGVNIGSAIIFTTSPPQGLAFAQINLSGITALQNVPSSTTITIRLYGYQANAAAGGSGFGSLAGDDLAIGGILSPVTGLTLDNFKATSATGGVVLEWRTGFEVSNLGFNLYREQKGKRVQVNPSIIAGSAFFAGQDAPLTAGDSYSWPDLKGKSDSVYYLEDIDLKGKRTLYGPIVPAIATSSSQRLGLQRALLLSELNNQRLANNGSSSQRGWAVDVEVARDEGDQEAGGGNQFNPGPGAAKISVKTAGWYRVTYANLTGIGFNTNVDPKTLQLFDNGEEVPILLNVADKKVFAPGDSFEFYGHGLDNPFTDTNVYWLVGGAGNGKKIEPHPGNNSINASTKGVSFPYTVESRERLLYIPSILNGEKDNFIGQVITGVPVNQNLFVEKLSPVATGDALLEVALVGYTTANHQVKVKVNGQDVGTLNFIDQEFKKGEINVPYSILNNGANTITLERLSGALSVSLVEYVRLTYEHSYLATGNVLFFSAKQNVLLDGFTNANIRVMDITDPLKVKEISHAVGPSTLGFCTVVHTGNEGNYLAFTSDSALTPPSFELDIPSNLRSSQNSANFVIISYAGFKTSLAPLVTLRQSQGMQVKVVDVQDVYDEFNDGEHSPYAIRDFLSLAKNTWQTAPKFVLMAGDASLDPRNYFGAGNTDYVPSKLVDTTQVETASDDWLVDFNNDSLPDMAIGRFPVNTATETAQLVAKVVGYNPGASVQKVLFIVDRTGVGDGISFGQVALDDSASLPGSLSVDTLDRTPLTDAVLRALILNGVNQSPLIVNYIGHGSVEVWANAAVLQNSDVALINNTTLPVWVIMTCLNGYYINSARVSLAEVLIRKSSGGAVAVWASSGYTDLLSQAKLNKQFYIQLFTNPGTTLGEAAKNAKPNVADLDVRKTWILFGDPTTKLQ